LLALRSSPPSFSVAEGERVARDLYGLALSMHPLPGERDRNFRARTAANSGVDAHEFVLKILDLTADASSVDCLVQVLRHLAEADPSLPVPRLIPTELGHDVGRFEHDGIAYATCLVTFLPGRLLADSPPSSVLLHDAGAVLARLDRALQGFFHPSLSRRLAWDVRRLPELIEFSGYIESAALRQAVLRVSHNLETCLPRLRGLRSQAIHGDCHSGNLLVDAEGESVSGILDFGDMIHAPRILEPAVAMSELLAHALVPLAGVAEVLRGYSRGQALESAEVEWLYVLVTARLAVMVLVHAWRSRHDASGARLLDEPAAHAGRALEELLAGDREALSRSWHAAAGTSPASAELPAPPPPAVAPADAHAAVLARRHRLMGKGAELFYEQPLHIVRGSGVWLYDVEGRAYLDVYNNVPHVGHTHPAVVEAIQRQTAILATHTRYLHETILEYAHELTSRLPAHLDTCIFVNSGSEANDVAWRIARMLTGNHGALVMEHAYHGITDAVAALTPSRGEPRDPHVVTLAAPPAYLRADGDMASAELRAAVENTDGAIARLRDRGFAPAAFYVDTAITSSGIFDPPPAWAAAVQERIRSAGGLIVADEVQYGLGRSGSHFWGFERRGLSPDIVTMGKPVGNGYPMGVVVSNRATIEAFQAEFGFFSTFGGNAVAASAGLAVLKVLDDEELMANASSTGAHLRAQLETVAARHECLGAVRGAGLLMGLEVLGPDVAAAKRRCKRIINALASEFRVLIGYEGPHGSILKLRPPMPFRPEHADRLVEAIEAAATAVDFGTRGT
jgi:4-aminobutyrate aminotransferase-like enzyme/Ser/Thr protein kinase RdoA (MazF antagonist)